MIYSKYSGKVAGKGEGRAYQDGGGKVREDRLQQARHLEIESISHGVWTSFSFILRLECVYGSRSRKL